MVNEEIVGGLMSALSRGEPLQKAMMTFYNSGYKKEEIEDAAKFVHSQIGAQAGSGAGSLQDAFKSIASKVGLVKKNPIKALPKQNADENSSQENIFDNKFNVNKENFPQKVSNYGNANQNAEQIAKKIDRAIRDLKQINLPSKIEIVTKNADSKGSTNVQKVSDYQESPPKQVSKVITYILVFLLIFLLGILATVFFFKDELIKIFNNLGLG